MTIFITDGTVIQTEICSCALRSNKCSSSLINAASFSETQRQMPKQSSFECEPTGVLKDPDLLETILAASEVACFVTKGSKTAPLADVPAPSPIFARDLIH